MSEPEEPSIRWHYGYMEVSVLQIDPCCPVVRLSQVSHCVDIFQLEVCVLYVHVARLHVQNWPLACCALLGDEEPSINVATNGICELDCVLLQ